MNQARCLRWLYELQYESPFSYPRTRQQLQLSRFHTKKEAKCYDTYFSNVITTFGALPKSLFLEPTD